MLLAWFAATGMTASWAGGHGAAQNEERDVESFKSSEPEVDPVVVNGVRYEVARAPERSGIAQTSGVLSAIDVTTGSEIWSIVVYPVDYSDGEERDAQENFITSLTLEGDGHTLLIENEEGARFAVSLEDQVVTSR